MAAVLELLLQEQLTVDAVLRWVMSTSQEKPAPPSLASLSLLQKDFVPFLLNFLREQTSQILTNGPSTPAKTPTSKTVSKSSSTTHQRTVSEKRASNSSGHRGSRMQLFAHTPNSSNASNTSNSCFLSPTSVSNDSSFLSRSNLTANLSGKHSVSTSPNLGCSPLMHYSEKRSAHKPSLGNFLVLTPDGQPPRRGRKKNNSSGRQISRDQGRRSNEEEIQGDVSWSANRRIQGGSDSVTSPPGVCQLNLNNLDEFPPMNASAGSTSKSKPSRRINPTPINDVHLISKSRVCFTSTPIRQSTINQHQAGMDVFTNVKEGNCSPAKGGSLHEEREILKKERSKLMQQTSSPIVLDPVTPTKSYSRNMSISADTLVNADSAKVTYRKQLNILAELYSACIAENLVPNIFLEFFFVLQLLTSRGHAADGECDSDVTCNIKDVVEQPYFQSVHNCVFFAVVVLDFQFPVISHLDKGTLKLLSENERISAFSSALHERLLKAYENSTAKVSLFLPPAIQSVSFQPETDNRSNFTSDRAFHIFKKQRDVFYELLREWEDKHRKADWDFERCLGSRIRGMMSSLSAVCNQSHFARLFQKQLVQMCKGPSGGIGSSSAGDNPDQDVLNVVGSDNLNRLKRLQERFVTPQSICGPCPPPCFPGYQEFFRDFILCAGNYHFNQHLMDSLCQEIKELDGISIIGHEPADGESDMDEQDEKIRFASVIMTLRLLAKFLGFIYFLPYRTTETLTSELQESALALRNQTLPMLDVLQLLRRSMQNYRIVLTVPWVVEYLSLVDQVAPLLDYYKKVFALLMHLYRYKLILAEEREMGFLNKLLILAALGWLFQVPPVPEELFFDNDNVEADFAVGSVAVTQGLDSMPLVDQQLLYSCCPYLGELKKLLLSFVAGSSAKNGGFLRKITPTAAEPLIPKPTLSQKKLQAELEQAFFHNQSPSLRRTVEFVAERIGSNCVKHIKATLVAELVKRAELLLQDSVTEDSSTHSKQLETVCTKLCEDGRQAVQKGKEYCTKKVPEALRVLLPEEISASVLNSAEDIAVALAIEKACSWLRANISALIKREVKAAFARMVKIHSQMSSSIGGENVKGGCMDGCNHKAPLPSQLITEIKDILSISVGPRDEEEQVDYKHLKNTLAHLSQTLRCRIYMCYPAEQHLAKSTVELASLLVSDRIPVFGLPSCENSNEMQKSKREALCDLLTLLLSVWKKDFRVTIPFYLMFSMKNITYITDIQAHKWELFEFMLHGLIEQRLMVFEEIKHHIDQLKGFIWPAGLLEKLALMSERHRSKQEDGCKEPVCTPVPKAAITSHS
ncbi:hypothetical protein XENTR_v10021900 [Xenopus tropicalis]|uniref:Codanin-1 n=1 Tax=Xenopus tropicalis TaxID=8364 RepID=A0A6I8QII0_XENTR|nr:codanin-1 [Xenopus tropicalis]KAE8587225.1 hypothetical protein XENTR_v10021900 [Xenopus tropicalis]|eukprot:XP_002941131.2 PREDICTED: codanin-1 isoform X1 [Xenopus tropicalis]